MLYKAEWTYKKYYALRWVLSEVELSNFCLGDVVKSPVPNHNSNKHPYRCIKRST